MHISNLRIKRLLTEYANGTIKAVDRDELLNYLKNVTNDPELDASLAELFDEMEVDPNLIIESDRIYHDLTSQSLFKGMRKPSKRMNLWWLAGTAAAIGLLVFRLFLLPEFSKHRSFIDRFFRRRISDYINTP